MFVLNYCLLHCDLNRQPLRVSLTQATAAGEAVSSGVELLPEVRAIKVYRHRKVFAERILTKAENSFKGLVRYMDCRLLTNCQFRR